MTDQLADLFTEAPAIGVHGASPVPVSEVMGEEVARLRCALTEALDAYTDAMSGHSQPLAANRFRALRELAAPACTPDQYVEPFERGMEGSARAAAKWTDEEVAKVDEVIKGLAEGRYYPTPPDGIEFTTADVWAILGDGFPVTKGIAGRMTAAKGAGLIESTGRTTYPPVNAPGPNNGQRLTVWRSLVGKV